MNKQIKTFIIISPIFLLGLIIFKFLNVLKLAALWLVICIILELIILELFTKQENCGGKE